MRPPFFSNQVREPPLGLGLAIAIPLQRPRLLLGAPGEVRTAVDKSARRVLVCHLVELLPQPSMVIGHPPLEILVQGRDATIVARYIAGHSREPQDNEADACQHRTNRTTCKSDRQLRHVAHDPESAGRAADV